MKNKRAILKDVVYNNPKEFRVSEFKAPADVYSAVYGWFWNAPISKKETLRQIKEFKSQGIKRIYIIAMPKTFRTVYLPTLLDPDYLTDGYFKQVEYAVLCAKRHGIEAWIYDEGGWPSGTACGKVVEVRPESAKSFIEVVSNQYNKGQVYEKSDDTAAAFANGKKIPDGYEFPEDCTVDEYVINHKAHIRDGLVNLMDKETTETFLKVTHENYEKHLCRRARANVTAYFTDEPALVWPFPFSRELAQKFRDETGIAIGDYLPYFYEKAEAETDLSDVYIKWFDFLSREFCGNFFAPCKKWINGHGYLFTGHMDKDDVPMGWRTGRSFHLMRTLRYMDMPGVDAIWQQIYPGKPGIIGVDPIRENRFYPRYASSAASQVGSNCAVAEIFGVYGSGLTFEKMRYVIGFLAVRGINVFNPFTHYGEKGFLMAGELPSFRKHQACMSDLKYFNEYVDRLMYLCSIGRPKNGIALYFPQNDLYPLKESDEIAKRFEDLGFSMEKRGVSFDIIDDDVLIACDEDAVKDGKIKMGFACCDTVVMQDVKHISPEAKEKLDGFRRHGGKILSSVEDLTPELSFRCDSDGIREYTRALKDGEITFIYNQDEQDRTVSLDFGRKDYKYAYEIDITDGKIYQTDGKGISRNLYSGEIFAVLFTDRSLGDTDEKEAYGGDCLLQTGWSFKRSDQCIIGDMELENKAFEDKYQPTELGDWQKCVGEKYSGSCLYQNSFKKPDTAKGSILIDCGTVNYTCELFINGRSYGVKVMKPYSYTVPVKDLKDDNVMELRVTNTMANERIYTKSFDKWDKNMLSSYTEKQTIFDRESLPSGLFGPLRIKY